MEELLVWLAALCSGARPNDGLKKAGADFDKVGYTNGTDELQRQGEMEVV